MSAMKPERHFDFGSGMYRSTPPIDPDFPEDAFYDGLNMVYSNDSDNPESMYGATRIGTTDMGGTVSGLFDYNNGDKLIACATNGTIYQYTASDWVAESGARATGNSSAAGTRWSGAMFYGATATANLLVLCNGVDAPAQYNNTDIIDLAGTAPATGNFPTQWQGRLWLADATTLYWSAPNNCQDWTTGGGGGSLAVERGADGSITGLYSFANNLFIFKRGTVLRIGPLDVGSLGVNNLKNVSRINGCVNHQTIQEGELGGRHVLLWQSEHSIEAIGPDNSFTGFSPVDISRWIKPIYDDRNIESMNTSWGLFNMRRKEYYSFIPTGTKTVPSMALVANCARRVPRWTRMDRNGLTAGVVFQESNTHYRQYVGDTNGRVYEMHDADTVLWAGSSFNRSFQSKFYVQDAPEYMKLYNDAMISADNTPDAVNVNLVLLRQGLPAYAGNRKAYAPTGSQGWGVGQWGVEPWGGSGTVGERIRFTAARRGTGVKVIVDSYGWFRLRGIVINSKLLSTRIAA